MRFQATAALIIACFTILTLVLLLKTSEGAYPVACKGSPCQEQSCDPDKRQCPPSCECWEGLCQPRGEW